MADVTVAEWIARRREVERCATSGPWHQGEDGHRYGNAREAFTRKDMHDPESYDAWPEAAYPEDAAFVVDARTSLPLALDALEAALELAKRHRAFVTKRGRDDCICTICDMCRAIETALRGAS